MSAPLYDPGLRLIADAIVVDAESGLSASKAARRSRLNAPLPFGETELRAVARDHEARKVVVVAPDGRHEERRDDGRGTPTLCLAGVEANDRSLASLAAHVKEAVAEPGRVLVNAYLSERSQGFGLHLDAQHVWVVQIAGKKRWTYGRGPAWIQPSFNLLHQDHDALPDHLREDVAQPDASSLVTETLAPGDVLYLPPGTWHATAAEDGPSVSISVTFVPAEASDDRAITADRRWRGTPLRRAAMPPVLDASALLAPGPLPPPALLHTAARGVVAYFGPEKMSFEPRERVLVALLGRTSVRVAEALALSSATGVSADAVRRTCALYLSRGAVHVA